MLPRTIILPNTSYTCFSDNSSLAHVPARLNIGHHYINTPVSLPATLLCFALSKHGLLYKKGPLQRRTSVNKKTQWELLTCCCTSSGFNSSPFLEENAMSRQIFSPLHVLELYSWIHFRFLSEKQYLQSTAKWNAPEKCNFLSSLTMSNNCELLRSNND